MIYMLTLHWNTQGQHTATCIYTYPLRSVQRGGLHLWLSSSTAARWNSRCRRYQIKSESPTFQSPFQKGDHHGSSKEGSKPTQSRTRLHSLWVEPAKIQGSRMFQVCTLRPLKAVGLKKFGWQGIHGNWTGCCSPSHQTDSSRLRCNTMLFKTHQRHGRCKKNPVFWNINML